MAEIELRFPSAIPYAYVGFKGTVEEVQQLNPAMLAAMFANAFNAFQSAEKAAALRIIKGDQAEKDFAPEIEASEKLLVEELGATKVSEAPYDAAPPAAQAKPWESKKPAAQVAVDLTDW